jgi:hypothetical protein
MIFKEDKIIAKQKENCLKYGADFLSAPFNSLAGIALDTFDGALKPINGLRHPPEGANDNGWSLVRRIFIR